MSQVFEYPLLASYPRDLMQSVAAFAASFIPIDRQKRAAMRGENKTYRLSGVTCVVQLLLQGPTAQ